MVRKKIDNRIRVMIENGMALGHRGLFVVVGDKGRDQVVILHHMLSKAAVKARPSVLWCFKKELGFSSHRKKKMKSLQKKIKQGKLDVAEDDPFELFVASTTIRYCYYKETHKILGNTYGMCVLQDFEALTPNLLARTMETVEGGGLVVLLLKTVDSLKQLFTMTMDVHARYRTEAHDDVTGRFNERFILSLANNKRCIVMDDGLNILPLSSHVKHISEVQPRSAEDGPTAEEAELADVRDKFRESQPTGVLLNLCKTRDQAKALLEFIDAITDKKLDRTVSLTAARGRGKSAALGLAIAAAIGFGYSNIFVTSPSPENLHTLFDFVFKGFDAMAYEEHTDYDLVQSTNSEFNNAVVRVNVHEEKTDNSHRQTIQYIHPNDAHKLGQAELLIIDEAAAIPLPLVKSLLGPYLVFMSSTINGYEGTGRSLSLKLLEQLRQQSSCTGIKAGKGQEGVVRSRGLREVTLEESIRYKPGDAVEEWLNGLLCLDATIVPYISSGTPPKEDCNLYYINRDTLFCYHKASEAFLQRVMALFVASHYKNTPNDLQLLSDAPAHHLFCLLGPTNPDTQTLPEVLCVLQVCLEGEISKSSIMHGLSRGKRAAGDLIPWTMAQQFQDDNFPNLSGARIVRIATHPNYQSMGYGSRAMELLQNYYEMNIPNLDGDGDDELTTTSTEIRPVDEEDVSLLEETIRPRKHLPPLLLKLSERRPERLDYIGVSYGLTQPLLKFWKRSGFTPVYVRQTANDLTGEHTTIMIKPLRHDDSTADTMWLPAFWSDFRRRFVNLLGFEFRSFSPALALSLICNKSQAAQKEAINTKELSHMVSPYDMKRLELYSNNMADYHLVTDLMPTLARLFFLFKVDNKELVHLSALQQAILVGIGLQCRNVDGLAKELDLPSSQLLGLFNAMLRKLTASLRSSHEKAIEKSLDVATKNGNGSMAPLTVSMNDELQEAANELMRKQKEELDRLKSLDLSQYRIKGTDQEWSSALKDGKVKSLVSVKTGEKRASEQQQQVDDDDDQGSKKKKKFKENKSGTKHKGKKKMK